MDDIVQKSFAIFFFLNKKFPILNEVSMKCIPESPVNKKSALVQVMAWLRTGDKPLPEPMMTKFHDDMWPHSDTMI